MKIQKAKGVQLFFITILLATVTLTFKHYNIMVNDFKRKAQ